METKQKDEASGSSNLPELQEKTASLSLEGETSCNVHQAESSATPHRSGAFDFKRRALEFMQAGNLSDAIQELKNLKLEEEDVDVEEELHKYAAIMIPDEDAFRGTRLYQDLVSYLPSQKCKIEIALGIRFLKQKSVDLISIGNTEIGNKCYANAMRLEEQLTGRIYLLKRNPLECEKYLENLYFSDQIAGPTRVTPILPPSLMNTYNELASREISPQGMALTQQPLSFLEARSFDRLSRNDLPKVALPAPSYDNVIPTFLSINADGKILAMNRGKENIMLIDIQEGKCVFVINFEHIPSVVTFHPFDPSSFSIGFLNGRVEHWKYGGIHISLHASNYFGQLVRSIAFHPFCPYMAVVSAHSVHIWRFEEVALLPVCIARDGIFVGCQFHPHPHALFLLTVEARLPSAGHNMTWATSGGYSKYPLHVLHRRASGPYSANDEEPAHDECIERLLLGIPPISSSVTIDADSCRFHGIPGELFTQYIHVKPVDGSRGEQIEAEVPVDSTEIVCLSKLRTIKIWPHDSNKPCEFLRDERLLIDHVLVCNERTAYFSPCGRFLAACVACVKEKDEDMDASVSVHKIMYEIRIYSMEEHAFGHVLSSRAIRDAHCLKSMQFSPTSEHLLLAYGGQDDVRLRTIFIGDRAHTTYAIIEIYQVSDMKLVKVFTSPDDIVSEACFHPLVGGGLVYGRDGGELTFLR